MAPFDKHAAAPAAAELLAFARRLGGSIGYEPSCKISAAGVDNSRFLMSFSASPDRVAATRRFLARMGLAAAACDRFGAQAVGAGFLHLGFEGGEGAPGYKVYCERRGDAPHGDPVHIAWKWRVGDGDRFAVDRYHLAPDAAGAIVGALENGPLADALLDLTWSAVAADAPPMTLDVRREGAARHSVDLGLHAAGMVLADAAPLLRLAERTFTLAPFVDRLLAEAGHDALGHVAAGRDDGGEPFLTVYHGARELT